MNIAATDLNLLVAFDALLEERSVTRAARRVGLSQPAMSAALARLRGLFEDRLFERTSRGIEPTQRAMELAVPVRAGLMQLRRALEGDASFEAGRSERTFRLAMTDYAEWLLLGPLMAALGREAPGVQLQVRRLERLFAAPEGDLRSGAVDLAVGFFPDARTLQEGTLEESLFEERNVVIARRGGMGRMTLEAFAAARHAAIIYRPEPWGLIDQELAARGKRRVLRLAAPHFLTVLEAVAGSDLIAVVPERLARRFRSSLRLDVRPVPFPMPVFHTRMAWHQQTSDDPAQRWLRGQVVAAAQRVAPERRNSKRRLGASSGRR